MTYATSDLHGYPLDSFLRLLEKAGFSDSDVLYVLGDVIDRNGDGGSELLCLAEKHERMATTAVSRDVEAHGIDRDPGEILYTAAGQFRHGLTYCPQPEKSPLAVFPHIPGLILCEEPVRHALCTFPETDRLNVRPDWLLGQRQQNMLTGV